MNEIEKLKKEVAELRSMIQRRLIQTPMNATYLVPFMFRQGQEITRNASRVDSGDYFVPQRLRGTPCVRIPRSIEDSDIEYRPNDPDVPPYTEVNCAFELKLSPDHDETGNIYVWYGLCMPDPWGQWWLISPPMRTVEKGIRQFLPIVNPADPNYPGWKVEFFPISVPYSPTEPTEYVQGGECS